MGRASCIGLSIGLALFAAAGVARLNPFCLFEPDSADYLFQARALAAFEGYIEPDHPDRPPQTFRPPGLPLLLAPLALARPYDVVAAKGMVLATALAMLAAVFLLAREAGGPLAALAAALFVATSPYMLLHATEVLSEAPYVAATLLVLLFLAKGGGTAPAQPRARRTAEIACALLLAFVPLLRTIGAALVAAVAADGLRSRARRRELPMALVALVPLAWWVARGARLGGPTYLGNVAGELSRLGASGFAARALDAIGGYLVWIGDTLFPGFTAARPVYGEAMLGAAPRAGLPDSMVALLGLLAAAAAMRGMWARRDREGFAALLYVPLYLVALAIYPPRHERLAWPLVPLFWIYLSAAVRGLGARWARPVPPRALAAAAAALLAFWQSWSAAQMVRANLAWWREGDRFYEERVPTFYFADWRAAGRWIADNSPPHARVLARHSDAGLASRRFQDSLRFEEQSPAEWHRAIERLRARYLVVPASLFGKMFDLVAAGGDPVYELAPVHRARDVIVLEVRPNRSGTARSSRSDLLDRLEACRRAVERMPGREDLLRRLAELLVEAGRPEEAVQLLRGRLRAAARDEVALRVGLAEALLAAGEPAQAREALLAARQLPGAREWTGSIERSLRKAEAALRLEGSPPQARARELVALARSWIAAFHWERASRLLDEAQAMAPEDPEVLYARAEVLQRTGRLEDAARAFTEAGRRGHPGAARKLELLRGEALLASGGLGGARDWLALAALHVEDGVPGRALAILEAARERLPDEPEIALRLADLYLFFGEAERSAPLYEALAVQPRVAEHARRGLALSKQLLAPARF